MKKYRPFPRQAIFSLVMLIVIGGMILIVVEKNMPQYGSWRLENSFINKDRRAKMKAIKNVSYPLINLPSSHSVTETTKKILVIGDSYIEGDGCSNFNQTWWRQLELELQDRGYQDVKVYGAGTNGASTYDEMNWLSNTSLVTEVDPDLIIIGYVINDPEIDNEKGTPIIDHIVSTDYFTKNKVLKKIAERFPNITYKINNMINSKVMNQSEYNDETGYPTNVWYSVITNETWAPIYKEKAVDPLGEYLTSIDIPSFVITTPNGRNPEHRNWYHVLSYFEKNGIKTYNMFEDFRNMAEGLKNDPNTKINPVNGHPGTAYTKYYAEYIADILEKDYRQVLGEKTRKAQEYSLFINDWVPYHLNMKLLQEDENCVTYQFTYPGKDNMLYMPIKKEYIKLSLEYPVSIKKIRLQGGELQESEVYVTTISDELGYDNQSMKKIGRQKGNQGIFSLEEKELITSVNIHAKIPVGRTLTITIER